MGIPSFYGWLVRKYPSITTAASEQGGYGYSNFYLDMNSIIHTSFHPQYNPPTTFEQVFQSVEDRIGELVSLIRPANLLYLAMDGVAPRAKMNQQRARRFIASRESEELASEEHKVRNMFNTQGKHLPPEEHKSEVQDSNVITPGTWFMSELSNRLRRYVLSRLEEDVTWTGLKVVISDSSVPGEGEHKIMDFIRRSKHTEDYDPNLSHCVFGSDADLILLTLATHEKNFSVLRETREWVSEKVEGYAPLELVHIGLLRDYVIQGMCPCFDLDYERVIDDFVFLCCLIGNDFLPHLPNLVINDGCVDWMMCIYKSEFAKMGDFLTCNGSLNTVSFGHFIQAIAAEEESYLENKYKKKNRSRRHHRRWFSQETVVSNQQEPEVVKVESLYEEDVAECINEDVPEAQSMHDVMPQEEQIAHMHNLVGEVQHTQGNEPLDEADVIIQEQVLVLDDLMLQEEEEVGDVQHAQVIEDLQEDEEQKNLEELKLEAKARVTRNTDRIMSMQKNRDQTKLGLPGWKTRYYSIRLQVPKEDTDALLHARANMVLKYIEGLQWIIWYYYHGVCSWQWYYPYYYAPFASDFVGLNGYSSGFTLGQRLKPLQQLMAVLPPQSVEALPLCYRSLMLDENSPLREFYPKEFSVDYRDVNKAWKGVVKLPFVDEEKLVAATNALDHLLSVEERERNCFSSDIVLHH